MKTLAKSIALLALVASGTACEWNMLGVAAPLSNGDSVQTTYEEAAPVSHVDPGDVLAAQPKLSGDGVVVCNFPTSPKM